MSQWLTTIKHWDTTTKIKALSTLITVLSIGSYLLVTDWIIIHAIYYFAIYFVAFGAGIVVAASCN